MLFLWSFSIVTLKAHSTSVLVYVPPKVEPVSRSYRKAFYLGKWPQGTRVGIWEVWSQEAGKAVHCCGHKDLSFAETPLRSHGACTSELFLPDRKEDSVIQGFYWSRVVHPPWCTYALELLRRFQQMPRSTKSSWAWCVRLHPRMAGCHSKSWNRRQAIEHRKYLVNRCGLNTWLCVYKGESASGWPPEQRNKIRSSVRWQWRYSSVMRFFSKCEQVWCTLFSLSSPSSPHYPRQEFTFWILLKDIHAPRHTMMWTAQLSAGRMVHCLEGRQGVWVVAT